MAGVPVEGMLGTAREEMQSIGPSLVDDAELAPPPFEAGVDLRGNAEPGTELSSGAPFATGSSAPAGSSEPGPGQDFEAAATIYRLTAFKRRSAPAPTLNAEWPEDGMVAHTDPGFSKSPDAAAPQMPSGLDTRGYWLSCIPVAMTRVTSRVPLLAIVGTNPPGVPLGLRAKVDPRLSRKARAVPRDLLPLPLVDDDGVPLAAIFDGRPPSDGWGRSRPARQRRGRVAMVVRRANDVIIALNTLGRFDAFTSIRPSRAQPGALRRIFDMCNAPPPPFLERPEAALRALLGSPASGGRTSNKMRLPITSVRLPIYDVGHLVARGAIAFVLSVEGFERLQSKVGVPPVYYDPALHGSRPDYVNLIEELHQRSMAEYRRGRAGRIKFVSVRQKSTYHRLPTPQSAVKGFPVPRAPA